MKRTVLYLYLTNILPKRPLVIGPAPWFQMSGNVLRRGPSGESVAEYSKNSWLVRGEYYTAIRFGDRACVQFSDSNGGASQSMGPFNELAVSDGVASVENQPFAQFHPDSQLWRPCRMEGAWPNMTIKPVVRD
jgi:hypothetical protein